MKTTDVPDPIGPLTRTHLELRISQGDVRFARRLLDLLPNEELNSADREALQRRLDSLPQSGKKQPTAARLDPPVAAQAGDLGATFRARLSGATSRRDRKIATLNRWLQQLERLVPEGKPVLPLQASTGQAPVDTEGSGGTEGHS